MLWDGVPHKKRVVIKTVLCISSIFVKFSAWDGKTVDSSED